MYLAKLIRWSSSENCQKSRNLLIWLSFRIIIVNWWIFLISWCSLPSSESRLLSLVVHPAVDPRNPKMLPLSDKKTRTMGTVLTVMCGKLAMAPNTRLVNEGSNYLLNLHEFSAYSGIWIPQTQRKWGPHPSSSRKLPILFPRRWTYPSSIPRCKSISVNFRP